MSGSGEGRSADRPATAAPAPKPRRTTRADYALFRPVSTRWSDVDVYGHVNNVVYYAWFDVAVNGWLVEARLLDPARSAIVGLVAGTACDYFESVGFPETVDVGLAVAALGRSSVTYRLGVFRAGSDLAAAQGRFTHVHVERGTTRTAPIPEAAREAMAGLVRAAGEGESLGLPAS